MKNTPFSVALFFRGFLHLYGEISSNSFDRYKNDVFPLLDVSNYHTTEYPMRRQIEIKKTTVLQINQAMNGVEILCSFFMGYP